MVGRLTLNRVQSWCSDSIRSPSLRRSRRRLSEVRGRPEATGTPSPAKFREAVFADHAQIAHLESRYGLTPKSYEAWSHLWLANPLYRTFRQDWPIGWVLEDDDGRIVGSMGNI